MKAFFFLLVSTMLLFSCSTKKQNKNALSINDINADIIYTKTTEEQKQELATLSSTKAQAYKIGVGDTFAIEVYDEPEMSSLNLIVKPDGFITIKLVGEVNIKGLTIPEAVEQIEELLSKFVKTPKISLMPITLASSKFSILGKVRTPGSYPLTTGTKLLDAIAVSGGFPIGTAQDTSIELADLEHSYITRNGKILPVDFTELVRKGNKLHNIPILSGDYIYIPSALNREIYIIGEVNSPGSFPFKTNMTLMKLVATSRGLRDTATSQAIIVRGSLSNPKVYSFNIYNILRGEAVDIKLQPDDIVFFPKSFLGNWNMILSMILPTMSTIQSAYMLDSMINSR